MAIWEARNGDLELHRLQTTVKNWCDGDDSDAAAKLEDVRCLRVTVLVRLLNSKLCIHSPFHALQFPPRSSLVTGYTLNIVHHPLSTPDALPTHPSHARRHTTSIQSLYNPGLLQGYVCKFLQNHTTAGVLTTYAPKTHTYTHIHIHTHIPSLSHQCSHFGRPHDPRRAIAFVHRTDWEFFCIGPPA